MVQSTNTILVTLAEWSTLGKTRILGLVGTPRKYFYYILKTTALMVHENTFIGSCPSKSMKNGYLLLYPRVPEQFKCFIFNKLWE